VSWKEAKQVAKNRVRWQKFVLALFMFHLGITGDDGDDTFLQLLSYKSHTLNDTSGGSTSNLRQFNTALHWQ
jgi:hypothetical protein